MPAINVTTAKASKRQQANLLNKESVMARHHGNQTIIDMLISDVHKSERNLNCLLIAIVIS